MTSIEVVDHNIATKGWTPDIGQIDHAAKLILTRRIRRGEMAKWRGYWTTGHAAFGFGPLKTIYGTPECAAAAARYYG